MCDIWNWKIGVIWKTRGEETVVAVKLKEDTKHNSVSKQWTGTVQNKKSEKGIVPECSE